MTAAQRKRHRIECEGYCRTLNDQQVLNVYADETKRSKEQSGDVSRVAVIFAHAALVEAIRRGLDDSGRLPS